MSSKLEGNIRTVCLMYNRILSSCFEVNGMAIGKESWSFKRGTVYGHFFSHSSVPLKRRHETLVSSRLYKIQGETITNFHSVTELYYNVPIILYMEKRNKKRSVCQPCTEHNKRHVIKTLHGEEKYNIHWFLAVRINSGFNCCI